MNEQNERNEKLNKIFAAIGLVVIIILLAWLAVQVVRFLPVAFSSLANVFEANQRQLHEQMDDENEVIVVDDSSNEEDIISSDDTVDDSKDASNDETDEFVEDSEDNTDVDTSTDVDDTESEQDEIQYETVVTYKVPTSDPNGYTDFEVSYVAVGHLNSHERFVPNSDLEQEETAAMQFSVKNTGTKTSGNWHFTAELPDGEEITSRTQLPLKPAETATFTVLFKTGDDRGYDHIGATVLGGNDINSNNNSFRTRIYIR